MWRRATRTALCRFHDAAVHDLSLVTIAGSYATDMEAVRIEVRRIRRSLRDLRDATAEKRSSWRGVRIAGVVELLPCGNHGPLLVRSVAGLLVHHPRVARRRIERVMQEWFSGSGRDVDVGPYRADAFVGSSPGTGLPLPWRAAVGAALFEWGRGLEPLRVAIGPQCCFCPRANPAAQWVAHGRATAFREPMPVVF